jgi:hypothetical protein
VKRTLFPILVGIITMTACSTEDDRLASECAKINELINTPISTDFTQLRALQPELSDERLAEQVGIIAENWEATEPGAALTPERGEQITRSNDAQNTLTMLCEKTGEWHLNRPNQGAILSG